MQIDIGPFSIRPIHIILGAVGISALVVLVLVLVMLPTESADTQYVEQVDEGLYPWATADRLVVPEDFSELEFEWVPYRGRRAAWTPEQIAEYWHDPNEIGLEVLGETLEAEVRSFIEDTR